MTMLTVAFLSLLAANLAQAGTQPDQVTGDESGTNPAGGEYVKFDKTQSIAGLVDILSNRPSILFGSNAAPSHVNPISPPLQNAVKEAPGEAEIPSLPDAYPSEEKARSPPPPPGPPQPPPPAPVHRWPEHVSPPPPGARKGHEPPPPPPLPPPSPQSMHRPPPAGPAPGPDPEDITNEFCCNKFRAINFYSNLPLVLVDTGGKGVNRSHNEAFVCTCSHGLKKGDVNMTAVFRVRGGTNSQMRNQIHQYAVDIEHKEWFLGMHKSKSWMLYAQDIDPFGLHQHFGYWIGSQTGMWTISTRFCELFIVDDQQSLNYPQHYHGIYLAMEKPEAESNRVNVTRANPGANVGVLAQFKHSQNPDNLPTVNGSVTGKEWNIEYPKKHNITDHQLHEFQRIINRFEDMLYGRVKDKKGWTTIADKTSFCDWFLTTEIIKNTKHSYHSSAWIHREDSEGSDYGVRQRLRMGPLWDLVQGFGTCCGYPVKGFNTSAGVIEPNPYSGGTGISSSGWLFKQCTNNFCPALDDYAPGYGISTWFQQLFTDKAFADYCPDRYYKLRTTKWKNEAFVERLNQMKEEIFPAAMRTLGRWEHVLYQWEVYHSYDESYNATFNALQTWVLDRLNWIDNAWQIAANAHRNGNVTYPSSFGDSRPVNFPLGSGAGI